MSGPYIVTVKEVHRGHSAQEPDLSVHRRAVATLDEARERCFRAWGPFDHPDGRDVNQRVPYLDSVRALPDSGGTIGPLPDGTVIEVERVTYDDLGGALSAGAWLPEGPLTEPDLIAAFNEAHDRGGAL